MVSGDQLRTTKILFVESDEISFQVRECMAKVLNALPPIELFHARDATEALAMLEQLKPDVIVLDDENPAESDLFMESMVKGHAPIVIRTDTRATPAKEFSIGKPVTFIPKGESLDGIHQTLMLVTAIGVKGVSPKYAESEAVH